MKLRLWLPDGPRVNLIRRRSSRTVIIEYCDLPPVTDKTFARFFHWWIDTTILPLETDE